MPRILVVDDEFGVADVLKAILEDAGYAVTISINGRQALEKLAISVPDLILLDFMMPELNGPGFLRAIQADPKYRTIPVVMMSSLGESVVREHCDGYLGFLRKPFRIDAVMRIVEQVAGKAGQDPGAAPA